MAMNVDPYKYRTNGNLSNSTRESAYERYIRRCAADNTDPIGYVEWLAEKGIWIRKDEVIRLLDQLSVSSFYGTLELKYECGAVVLCRKTETIKSVGEKQ